ncbi:dienelactone hydrolase family protein [Scytonema sp. PCC 10023]|uniref:dienelactone hydrolase family protein n=1 Tax=Scytonema sp. PCC 10023 TaxID=1680591 RepID=UPI0039C68491
MEACVPSPDTTLGYKGPIYAFFSTKDTRIPIEQTEQVEAELQKHQIPHQVFRYEAEHGSWGDRRASYNPEAAADAWKHVLELFQQNLQKI